MTIIAVWMLSVALTTTIIIHQQQQEVLSQTDNNIFKRCENPSYGI
jgi:hypothetical protein